MTAPREDAKSPTASKPLVSVVIPAFNSAPFIVRALDSVAGQTYRPLEVILVDDASADDTTRLAAETLRTADFNYRILHTARRSGPAHARNTGVAAATGRYVAFLDSDDLWLPAKIERQVRLMEANPAVTLCGCQALWVPEEAEEPYLLFRNLPQIYKDGLSELFWNCYIATPCAMARRDDLGLAPFNEALRAGEDRDLWLRLASNGAVGLVQETLAHIRISPQSYMSTNYNAVLSDVLPMIRYHLRTMKHMVRAKTRRLAIGKVYSDIGKPLCTNGSYIAGALFLLRASLLGHRPLQNMRHLIHTSPLLQFVKTQIRVFNAVD